MQRSARTASRRVPQEIVAPHTLTPHMDVLCHGGTGSLRYKVLGGTYPYTLTSSIGTVTETIAAGDTLFTISGLPATNYTFTVRDSKNCSATAAQATITQPTQLQLPAPQIIHTTCELSNGILTAQASGGVAPYTYILYSFSAPLDTLQTGSFNNLSAGVYQIKVLDTNGCSVQSADLTINGYTNPSITTITVDSVRCFGESNGTIRVTSSRPVQTYLLYNADNTLNQSTGTGTFNNLPAGTYNIYVEDTNGCRSNTAYPAEVREPQAVSLAITSVTRVSDKGSATGTISVSTSGGNSGHYILSLYEQGASTALQTQSGVSAYTFTGLRGTSTGKTYTIQAVDVKGCVATKDTTVIEPAVALQLSDTISSPVACYNESNAVVTLSAKGGWGEYKYSLANPPIAWRTTADFSGLHAGNYTFYVKDKYDGRDTVSVTIGQPDSLTIDRDDLFPVLCHGEATGWIRYKITGGTSPYWLCSTDGTKLTTGISESTINGEVYLTIHGLLAGTYTFKAKDSRNCTTEATPFDTIFEPAKLHPAIESTRDLTCEYHDGEIKAKAWGGVAPYTFVLANDSLSYSQTKTGADSLAIVWYKTLYAGQYRLTVTDDNGCSESTLVTINPYIKSSVGGATVQNVACYGESNGWIQATSMNGTNDVVEFKLTSSDGSYQAINVTGLFENLKADTYAIKVIDEIGCESAPYQVKVNQPDSLSIKVIAIHASATKGAAGGKITFEIAGGNTGSKTVRLKDNSGAVVDSLSGTNNAFMPFTFDKVLAGNYYLEITDDTLGCQGATGWLEVTEPADNLHLVKLAVHDALCKSQTGSIAVQGVGGWGHYRYKRAIEENYSDMNRFENLYPGNYLITVIDSLGTTYSETITVYEPQDSLQAQVIGMQLPTCGNTGSLSIRLSGGTAPYKLYNQTQNLFLRCYFLALQGQRSLL
ncbi:hypothetical protein AGMMS49525_02910 [Bacteroidia bacterium]|nr:hypothetical protein AGMMS49525_02910 [Bacteroidia bacterium]